MDKEVEKRYAFLICSASPSQALEHKDDIGIHTAFHFDILGKCLFNDIIPTFEQCFRPEKRAYVGKFPTFPLKKKIR